MANVLVLCTGDSCRSQMAQAYLQSLLPEGNRVYSAGIDPKPVHPLTIKVMAEDEIDISQATSNHINDLAHIKFAWILTVCDNAQDDCPMWVRFGKVIHEHFADPRQAKGDKAEVLATFRSVQQDIKSYCKELTENPISELSNREEPQVAILTHHSPVKRLFSAIERKLQQWHEQKARRIA